MAAAEGIHIPTGLDFIDEFNQAFLVGKDRFQGDFPQEVD